MLDRAGKLIMNLSRVQSERLLMLIILELILVYSCARILNIVVSLVRLGLKHFVSGLHLVSKLESTKNEELFWELLRYEKKSFKLITVCKLFSTHI